MNGYISRAKKNQLTILLFHGVIENDKNPVRNYNKKHITTRHFEDVLNSFQKLGNAISMDDLVGFQQGHFNMPDFPYMVTFDDGFANNFELAVPILDKLNIPSIFYLTTGFIENNGMSWIDRIEIIIERTKKGKLVFPWNKEVTSFATNEEKIAVLENIRHHVKTDPSINVDDLISDIYEQLWEKEIFQSDDILDRKLTWEQVKLLNENPLFTVGGHTHSHPIMSFLSEDELNLEVDICLDLLQSKAGIKTNYFSYPEGQANHFNEQVIRKLKDRGIKCCPTAIDGVNPVSENLFNLKRITVT